MVLGAGAWGTALALTLVRNGNNRVSLWGRGRAAVEAIRRDRENKRYLPGIHLPSELDYDAYDAISAQEVAVLVVAVPFQELRSVLEHLRQSKLQIGCVACACKGLEKQTFRRADQIVAEVMAPDFPFAMLSGPNFAGEIAAEQPAAISIATKDQQWGEDLLRRFHTPQFRPYLTDDVTGVALGGAIKNVIAIAAGISDGLQLGANARAALITRGLAEITRFGVAHGGRLETFMGLSGLGDLVLTCSDDQSRNRRLGLRLASGKPLDDAIAEIGLAEGAATAGPLVALAEAQEIDMPIASEVAATLAGKTTPAAAVRSLLARDLAVEAAGFVEAP